jgi:hypothetical protein
MESSKVFFLRILALLFGHVDLHADLVSISEAWPYQLGVTITKIETEGGRRSFVVCCLHIHSRDLGDLTARTALGSSVDGTSASPPTGAGWLDRTGTTYRAHLTCYTSH